VKHTSAHCKYSLKANLGDDTEERASIICNKITMVCPSQDSNNMVHRALYKYHKWLDNLYMLHSNQTKLFLDSLIKNILELYNCPNEERQLFSSRPPLH